MIECHSKKDVILASIQICVAIAMFRTASKSVSAVVLCMIDDGGRMAECANVSFLFVPYNNKNGITRGTFTMHTCVWCAFIVCTSTAIHHWSFCERPHTRCGDNYKASHIHTVCCWSKKKEDTNLHMLTHTETPCINEHPKHPLPMFNCVCVQQFRNSDIKMPSYWLVDRFLSLFPSLILWEKIYFCWRKYKNRQLCCRS